MQQTNKLLDIREASIWATEYLGKTVTPSNISYLINYGRIAKVGDNGNVQVAKDELVKYYSKNSRELSWKDRLGKDLNWTLSFDGIPNRKRQSTSIAYIHTKENLYRNSLNTFSTIIRTISKRKSFSNRATLFSIRSAVAEQLLYRPTS